MKVFWPKLKVDGVHTKGERIQVQTKDGGVPVQTNSGRMPVSTKDEKDANLKQTKG